MSRQFTPFNERVKPSKPYEEFPLFPHANGTWAKKIRGRLFYFGAWEDPDAALARYLEQKDDLHAGRTPRQEQGATTVKDAANHFLNHKLAMLRAGEIATRTWEEYRQAADLLVGHMGKT